MATLLEAGVLAGHVQRSSDLQRDPQYVHRAARHFDHAEMGNIPTRHQFRVSGYDNVSRFAAR